MTTLGIKMPDEVSNSPSLLQSPSSLFRRSLKASPVKQRRTKQLKKTFKSFSGLKSIILSEWSQSKARVESVERKFDIQFLIRSNHN